MRPTFVGDMAPGTWSIESEVALQNTWAISPTTRYYLQSLAGRRRSLDAEDIAAVHALSSENYLVDLELAQFDLVVNRQLAPDWGVFITLSGVRYGGGLFDSTIEQFHRTFRLDDNGRPAVRRGQINVFLDLEGQQYTALDAELHGGSLDPTVGVRYTGIQLDAPWQLVLETEAKVPLQGDRDWLSTGRADVGLQATLARRCARHTVYGNLSLVQYAGSGGRLATSSRLLPTVVAGCESHLTSRTHGIIQFYVSPSVYDGDQTQLAELLSTKYLLSIGLRHRRGLHLFTFGLTENVGSLQNTPDIGVQLGWAYRPPPSD